jgi:hypothetical protein
MPKNTISLAYDLTSKPRRFRVLPIAVLLFLGLALSPVLSEEVLLCYAQWCEIIDKPVVVRTPILDSCYDRFQTARNDLWNEIMPIFQRVPWNPQVVIVVGVLVMALSMVLLRTGGRQGMAP